MDFRFAQLAQLIYNSKNQKRKSGIMNRLYLLLLLIIWTAGAVEAQSLKQFQSEAEKAFDEKDFARSLDLYNKIINEADEKTGYNYYQAAESAREFRLYDFAEKYYKEVLKDSLSHNRFRLSSYHLGTVLKSQAKYDEAIQAFENFLSRDAAFVDEKYAQKAEKEIIDCDWAKTVTDDGTVIEHLDTTVNTPNSEFGPFEFDGTLYYSSVRFTTNRKYEPVPPLTRIFTSDLAHDGTEVSNDFNKEEDLHTGNVAFNADQTRMYYTICKNINVSETRCKIFFRDKNGDNWGPVDSLSNLINLDSFTTTQPSVGIDRTNGKEILFFVSDRFVDDSDNDKDLNIWCSYKDENGDWGEPGYIDSVNTDGDDVTPFFHTPTQTLYFSSNGFRNLGGFDIYSIAKDGDNWGTLNGMGKPLNSSYDEMYYTINDLGSMAYMSSNRPGGSCDSLDTLCVCNDIYRMPQICLKVRTFNKLAVEKSGFGPETALFGTEVVLNEINMNTPVSQSKQDDHVYDFFVGFDKSYAVDGAKEGGWLPDTASLNTAEMKGGVCDTVDLLLEPQVDVNVFTIDDNGDPLPGCKVEIYLVEGYTEYEFSPAKEIENSSQYNFRLVYGQKFRLIASKEGYSTAVSTRTVTDNIDLVPTTLRDELRLCKVPTPPKSLILYFENDMPGPRHRDSLNSNVDYSQLHGDYSNKESFILDFFKKRRKGNSGYGEENTFSGENGDSVKVASFFRDVSSGQNKLETFTTDLVNYITSLDKGDMLTVEIRGFASPLGPAYGASKYNKSLSQRRIDSVRKYFEKRFRQEFSGDEFEKQYAKLKVIQVPKGSDESSKKGDVPKRGLLAKLGIKASKERKVEIVGVRLSKNPCEK